MNRKNSIKKTEADFRNFIGNLQHLSPFDKKIEAAKIIDQTASVEVDRAWGKILSRIGRNSASRKLFTVLTRAAAVLTLPLLAFTIWSLFFQEEKIIHEETVQNDVTWQEIQSPAGMRSFVVLPDGTHLWLNAGSRLSYPIPFVRESREVRLSGEAYLDVAKNEKSPFVVLAENARVEVAGTQFNVNAYPESEKVSIALKEGKVKFCFADETEAGKFIELKPNDFLEIGKKEKKGSLKNINIEKYISWHQNIMILDDTPMTEVALLIEQWYGVKVVVASEAIKRYKFTTTFDNEPLHRVLELLQLSSPGITIKYTMGKPIAGTKKFSPSIVTFNKK